MSQQRQPRPGLRFKTKIQFLTCPHLSPLWGKAISPPSRFVGAYVRECARAPVSKEAGTSAGSRLTLYLLCFDFLTRLHLNSWITPSLAHFTKSQRWRWNLVYVLIGTSNVFFFKMEVLECWLLVACNGVIGHMLKRWSGLELNWLPFYKTNVFADVFFHSFSWKQLTGAHSLWIHPPLDHQSQNSATSLRLCFKPSELPRCLHRRHPNKKKWIIWNI